MRSGEAPRCPSCGRELDERDWVYCPRCREPIPAPGEELPPPGMLTDFGLGMAAFVTGGWFGLAAGLCLYGFRRSTMGLLMAFAFLPAAVGAYLAVGLGRRLIRPARRSFERLLLAFMLATVPVATVAMLAVQNACFLTAAVAAGGLAIYAYIRRFPPDWGLT